MRTAIAACPAPWHLFLVQDGSKSMLISAESPSIAKAEELVIATALDEFDMESQFVGARYLGVSAEGDFCQEI